MFKCIFLNENIWISIKISLKFVPRGPNNNILALIQIMAWHRLGDKQLSEPFMVRLSTHICISGPQWFKWQSIMNKSVTFNILNSSRLQFQKDLYLKPRDANCWQSLYNCIIFFSHYWPFMKGIYSRTVDTPHKRPVMREVFLCNDVRMVQYIPRNMHTVFALLCFVVVIHWLIFPYPPGLLRWHAPVPAKQPWWIWINTSFEFIMNDYITTTKQSTTKPCA